MFHCKIVKQDVDAVINPLNVVYIQLSVQIALIFFIKEFVQFCTFLLLGDFKHYLVNAKHCTICPENYLFFIPDPF